MYQNNQIRVALDAMALDAAPMCCLLLSKNFHIVYANVATMEFFDVANVDEILNEQIEHLFTNPWFSAKLPKEDFIKFLTKVLRTGHAEFDFISPTSDVLNRAVKATAHHVEMDDRPYIALFLQEASSQCVNCASEKELQNLENNLHLLVANLPTPSCTFDRNFSLVNCNGSAVDLFGMNDTQDLIDRFYETLPQTQPDGMDSIQKAKKYVADCFEQKRVCFEFMHVKAGGVLLPVEVTLIRFEWRGELFVFAFIKDLRDYYNYKKTEYTQHQKLQAILDSSPFVCVVLDAGYNVLEVNRKIEDLLGISSKQIYINNAQSFSPPFQPCGTSSKEKSRRLLDEAFEKGHVKCQWTYQAYDGSQVTTEEILERVKLDGKDVIILYARELHKEADPGKL